VKTPRKKVWVRIQETVVEKRPIRLEFFMGGGARKRSRSCKGKGDAHVKIWPNRNEGRGREGAMLTGGRNIWGRERGGC